MKKTTLFILVLCMISLGSFAKGKYKAKKGKSSDAKGYYSFSVGPSLPLGNYGTSDTAGKDMVGAAKLGLHINVANFGYKFTDNFGFCGIVNIGANSFNAEKITGTADKDSYWVYANVMLGPLASFDAGDKLTIDFRPMVGLNYAASPEANYNGNSVFIKSDRQSSFGFDIGASCRYHLSERADLALTLDYLSADKKFKPEVLGVQGEWKQKITLLGIGLGMAFRF